MAQASAFATGSACASGHGSASVVQTPIRPPYSNSTTYSSGDLADATTTSLLDTLTQHGGGLPQRDVATALREPVATMAAMADGTAPPRFFLSSLDPGVGKTTTLICLLPRRCSAILYAASMQYVARYSGFSALSGCDG
jgi:hypothetical protein